MKDYLFAYGTLATGKKPREIAGTVRKLKYVGDGYVCARLYDVGKYPAAKLSESSTNRVFGKLYELPDDPAILARLDDYEEYSPDNASKSLFVRKRVKVRLSNGRKLSGWVYVYNRPVRHLPRIDSGDFAKIAA